MGCCHLHPILILLLCHCHGVQRQACDLEVITEEGGAGFQSRNFCADSEEKLGLWSDSITESLKESECHNLSASAHPPEVKERSRNSVSRLALPVLVNTSKRVLQMELVPVKIKCGRNDARFQVYSDFFLSFLEATQRGDLQETYPQSWVYRSNGPGWCDVSAGKSVFW